MPRFAVVIHVRGPFTEADDVVVNDGAYTCRFVRAGHADGACAAAIEQLRSEPQFQSFRAGSSGGSPRIDIHRVGPAGFFEGRRGRPGYIFYDETTSDEAALKIGEPRASA